MSNIDDKCSYRKSFEANTTTFEGVGPDHRLYGCTRCDGYNVSCRYYATPKRILLRHELQQRYPAIFGPFVAGTCWP
jgi:hypothetical protein